MVEASAAVLETETAASRTSGSSQIDPRRMERADTAQAILTADYPPSLMLRRGKRRFDNCRARGCAVDSAIVSIKQIEQAIERLSAAERDALESRLLARRFGLDALSEAERVELMASLDEAERDIDQGQTYNGDELRQAVRSWLGK
jgi:hypothetical protein